MACFPIMMLKLNLPPLTRLWKPPHRPQMNCRLNQEWFLKSFTFESKCIALTNKFKNYVPHPKEMCVIFLVHHGFVPEFFLELFVALSQHSFIRKFIQRSFLFCNISKVDKKLPLLPPSDAPSLDGTTVWRVRCVCVCVCATMLTRHKANFSSIIASHVCTDALQFVMQVWRTCYMLQVQQLHRKPISALLSFLSRSEFLTVTNL